MISMTMIMIVMIRVLSNAAVDYELKRELRRSIDSNSYHISTIDGELNISSDFRYQDDNIHFVVLRRSGKLIAGEYPEEISKDLKKYTVRNKLSRCVICNGEKYYIRDIRIGRSWVEGKKKKKGVFVRGILKKSDADSFYYRMEQVSCLILIGILCVILTFEFILSKRISIELKNMCKTAECIGTSLDMSQRMKCDYQYKEIAVLAQANNRMLDRLEQTLSSQEQFTSDVAHELRTPVAVLLAQCEYARRAKTGEEYAEILEVVYRQSKRINGLITQLLKFSRLDQDRIQLEEETLDLMEIVQSVCEQQQEKTGESAVIRLHMQEAVATGDISLIAIVIQNLVGNAVKFSPQNGVIDVTTGEENGEAFVKVTDYGIGILPEDMENIFHRFYKCDESRNEEGFGLGLALSSKIAEKHGGRITAASVFGEGSTFTLYLPKR